MRIAAGSLSLTLALGAVLAPPSASAIDIEWVTLGAPGNACEVQTQGCFGAVGYEYRVGKLEVTNAEYVEFLNAVAATDANALYNTSMASGLGGITRSGSSGSYRYAAIAGREDMPVNYVSFWDATRFANWLHNGQPTGAQDDTTTEDGAYTLTPAGISNNTITRNAGAEAFVTSEDEWYKSAYYAAGSTSYFDYPAGSDTQTACLAPGATANSANCSSVTGDLTTAGSYTGAASPNGTFDQGGNVFEWSDTIATAFTRIARGGSFDFAPADLAAASRLLAGPAFELDFVGFRVASTVPLPALPLLGPLGLVLLSSILGLAGLCRLHA